MLYCYIILLFFNLLVVIIIKCNNNLLHFFSRRIFKIINMIFMTHFLYNIFSYSLLYFLLQYLSILKVRAVTVPTLFISGLADTLVPPRMMQDLYKNCRSTCKRILPVVGGTHNETWCQPNYYQNICTFLTELRENPPPRVTSSHWQIDDI